MSRGHGRFPRFAVMADIHGNAHACREALALARRRGFDRLVILGDLLTYGCAPTAVLDTVAEAVARDDTILVAGNHDQLYFDLARGETGYRDALPAWLRETVDWTVEAVAGIDLAGAFPWRERYEADGGLLFAHANPFGYRDWTYLNGPAEFARATGALAADGMALGVFGHTHRAKIVGRGARSGAFVVAHPGEEIGEALVAASPGAPVLVDPGSVGQPRDGGKESTILFLAAPEVGPVEVEHARVAYDVEAHKREIMNAALSPATRARLLGYLP